VCDNNFPARLLLYKDFTRGSACAPPFIAEGNTSCGNPLYVQDLDPGTYDLIVTSSLGAPAKIGTYKLEVSIPHGESFMCKHAEDPNPGYPGDTLWSVYPRELHCDSKVLENRGTIEVPSRICYNGRLIGLVAGAQDSACQVDAFVEAGFVNAREAIRLDPKFGRCVDVFCGYASARSLDPGSRVAPFTYSAGETARFRVYRES
jgi:hypothetical protein